MANRRPTALVLTPDFPPAHGGIQVLVERVLRHWSRIDPVVVTRGVCPGAGNHDTTLGYPVKRLHSRWRRAGHRAEMLALNARSIFAVAPRRIDVVLCGHVVLAPAALLIGVTSRAPIVQYLYGEEVADRRSLSGFAIRRARRTIAISSFCEQLGRRAAPDGRFVRIPIGVDIPPDLPSSRKDPPTLLTVARLTDAYKGHDVVLSALPEILKHVPAARWVVVGEGPLRQTLEQRARDLGLSDAVRFVGALSDSDRDMWYRQSHVFVMTSRISPSGGGEGFGIAFLEAAAHGLPVVAGNVGGARDAVIDGATGLLVEPTSASDVAAAVLHLLGNPEEAREFGRRAAERAHAYAWPLISRKVEDVLLELIAEQAA